MDNIKLRHQGGLVGHMDLLRDFEEQVDKVSMLGLALDGSLTHGIFLHGNMHLYLYLICLLNMDENVCNCSY